MKVIVFLLATSCMSFPMRQRYTSFKNFPVIGIKENHGEESPIEYVEELAETENIPRAARQVEPSSYTETLDDVFVEEAVYLTPADREQRALDNDGDEFYSDESDNFDYDDESLVEEENERLERDGAHGSHASGRHSANRSSRRFQQSQQAPQEENFRQPPPPAQEQRGGRQTGQIGSALGVLSNPPSANGDYNFK